MKISRLPFAFFGLCMWMFGCARPLPENALAITQVPLEARAVLTANSLDLKYPPGTRVVVVSGADFKDARVLSTGLVAAGDPVVSYDGRRVVFAGKISLDADWQIYEWEPSGGRPRPLTTVKGGAACPALLADGTLLYVSPVPAAKETPVG